MRTSVNAAFALAIAVGSALGPAMAIMLNRFDFIGWVPGYEMFLVNGMTGYVVNTEITDLVGIYIAYDSSRQTWLFHGMYLGSIPCCNRSDNFRARSRRTR